MNPNDLSIPELRNLLARKGYDEVDEFWDSLTEDEKILFNIVFDDRKFGVHDSGISILSNLSNYTKQNFSYNPDDYIQFINTRNSMKLLAQKIVSDYNLFLGFQRYVNYRLWMRIKEEIK